jgi:hypothetical protein
MLALIIGSLMLIGGTLAASHSLKIIRHGVRMWPHPLNQSSSELFLTGEFLVRYASILLAVAGFALIVSEVT